MEKLKNEFSHKGFNYRQVMRDKKVALYEQILGKDVIGFEVVRIKVLKPQERFGKHYPLRENYPSDNLWGIDGFTFNSYLLACNKYDELLEASN